jgi:CBS domain-containing protein
VAARVDSAGSLGMGYLLFRYFPDARGSGVPLIGTTKECPHVHADHSLHAALGRMASGLHALPVVSRANVHQLQAIVTLDDVLALYRLRHR